jgi:hypothetical protein
MSSEKCGRREFLTRLAAEFPDVLTQITRYEAGLLHCEVAAFRRATEQAIDAGRLWAAERHFRLVEELLAAAASELHNALEVSYLRDFALGECTPQRRQAVKTRMPRTLRQILIGHHDQWR